MFDKVPNMSLIADLERLINHRKLNSARVPFNKDTKLSQIVLKLFRTS